jgi:2-dehydro-3-deoxyphosphogluconate aldolase / (4S)-4-hydroxy-2-oxoglutarate aldolase
MIIPAPAAPMQSRELRETAARLIALRVIPVLRMASSDEAGFVIDCLIQAGFRTIELTLTTPDALDLMREMKERAKHHGDSGFLVGAGTVLTLAQAEACLTAGADYLVSPCVVEGLPETAHAAKRSVLMAGFTPGEVHQAYQAGSDIVKLFPASTGGAEHLKHLRAVFPHIPLCPTGSISQANMEQYFSAGANCVGIGNTLLDMAAVRARNAETVIAGAKHLIDVIKRLQFA